MCQFNRGLRWGSVKQLGNREKSGLDQSSPDELNEPVNTFICIPDTVKCNYRDRHSKAKHSQGRQNIMSLYTHLFCSEYKHQIKKADVFILVWALTLVLKSPHSLAKADCAVGLSRSWRLLTRPSTEVRGRGCSQLNLRPSYFMVLIYYLNKFRLVS